MQFLLLFATAIVVVLRSSGPSEAHRLFNAVISTTTPKTTDSTEILGTETSSNENGLEKEPATNGSSPSFDGKVKRLKELRAEMKSLTALIREEKRRGKKAKSKDDGLDLDGGKSVARQFRKWRKRVQTKMHSLTHRLDQLEAELHRQKESLRKMFAKGKGGKATVKNDESSSSQQQQQHFMGTPPIVAEGSRIRRVQIKRRGETGSACREHGDCKPGHCCVRDASAASGQCGEYNRKESAMCEHSCACEAQLLCFRKSDNNSTAICKRAAATDVLNGLYENGAGQSVFEFAQKQEDFEGR